MEQGPGGPPPPPYHPGGPQQEAYPYPPGPGGQYPPAQYPTQPGMYPQPGYDKGGMPPPLPPMGQPGCPPGGQSTTTTIVVQQVASQTETEKATEKYKWAINGLVVVQEGGQCPHCHSSGSIVEATSQTGLILAIVFYFFIGFYSLFFLLMKEMKCSHCGHVICH